VIFDHSDGSPFTKAVLAASYRSRKPLEAVRVAIPPIAVTRLILTIYLPNNS